MSLVKSLHHLNLMSHHKLFYQAPKIIRNNLNDAVNLATKIHENERSLIEMLHTIDQRRFYIRFGYKSLTGFCRFGLRFSKTQAQRIVTQVRRFEPTDNLMDEAKRALREKIPNTGN